MQRIYDGRILFRTFSDVLLAFAYASAIETFVLKLMFEFHNFFVFFKADDIFKNVDGIVWIFISRKFFFNKSVSYINQSSLTFFTNCSILPYIGLCKSFAEHD